MNYFIAIPSYKRAKILNEKTLKLLNDLGISKDRVNVFVVEEELETYTSNLDANLYNQIVVGVKGLVPQREFAEQFYPAGTKLIFLDDDLERLDLSLTTYTCADEFFCDAFAECEKQGAFIWGIHPCEYKFFRNSNKVITSNLKYIVGCFYGIINRPADPELRLVITPQFNGDKEDVERSILYFLKDGKTIRFNRVACITKYYGEDGGGLGKIEDRYENSKNASYLIAEKHSNNATIRVREKGKKKGMFELRLKNGKKVKK